MLKFLKNLLQKYENESENKSYSEEKKQLLSVSLEKNTEYFKKSFDESADLTVPVSFCGVLRSFAYQ